MLKVWAKFDNRRPLFSKQTNLTEIVKKNFSGFFSRFSLKNMATPNPEDINKATESWKNDVLSAGNLPGTSNVRHKAHAFGDLSKRR